MEIREVWSVAFKVNGENNEKVYEDLLIANNQLKFGGWSLAKMEDVSYCVFRAHIDADADSTVIVNVLQMVSEAADNKEFEFLASDDF